MSMSTRRAKLSNVIMPEEPAKLQPCQKIVDEKEHLPEDDNEEWEEVLVGSYIPLPVIWDEHPTAQKLEKLIEKMEFQVHQEPVPNITGIKKVFSPDEKRLLILPNHYRRTDPAQITLNRHFRTYSTPEELVNVIDEPSFYKSQGTKYLSTSPSGKFTVIVIKYFWLDGKVPCTVWRLDFGQTNPVKLLEATPQEPMFYAIPEGSQLRNISSLWTSDSYAYFATRDIIFRIDVYTGERKLVLQVQKLYYPGCQRPVPKDDLNSLRAIQIRKGLMLFFTTLFMIGKPKPMHFLRLYDEKENRVVRYMERPPVHHFWGQYALLKEGLVVKFNTGQKYKPGHPKFKNHYLLYRLDNLKLVTTHITDNSCQYSKNWYSINHFRIAGFPVFVESVFVEKRSYFFSLSVLFRQKFHTLSCPCPIDMRYKYIGSILAPAQHDPRLTELVVCPKDLKKHTLENIYVLKFKI